MLNGAIIHLESDHDQKSSLNQKRSRSPSPVESNDMMNSDVDDFPLAQDIIHQQGIIPQEDRREKKRQKTICVESTGTLRIQDTVLLEQYTEPLIQPFNESDSEKESTMNELESKTENENMLLSNDLQYETDDSQVEVTVSSQLEHNINESVSDSAESGNENQSDFFFSGGVKSDQLEYNREESEYQYENISSIDILVENNSSVSNDQDSKQVDSDSSEMKADKIVNDDAKIKADQIVKDDAVIKADEIVNDDAEIKADQRVNGDEKTEEDIGGESEVEVLTYDNDDAISVEFQSPTQNENDKLDSDNDSMENEDTSESSNQVEAPEENLLNNQNQDQSLDHEIEKDTSNDIGTTEEVIKFEIDTMSTQGSSAETIFTTRTEDPKALDAFESQIPQSPIILAESTQELPAEKHDEVVGFTQDSEGIPNSCPFITQLPVYSKSIVNSTLKSDREEPNLVSVAKTPNVALIPKKSILKSTNVKNSKPESSRKKTRENLILNSASTELSPFSKATFHIPVLPQEVSKTRGSRSSRNFQSLSEITIQNVRSSISHPQASKLKKGTPVISSKDESDSDTGDSDDDSSSSSSSDNDTKTAPIRSAKELRKKKRRRKSMLLRLAEDGKEFKMILIFLSSAKQIIMFYNLDVWD